MTDDHLRALNDATRRLIEQVRTLDAPDDVLVRVTAALQSIGAELSPHTYAGPYLQAQLRPSTDGRPLVIEGEPGDYFPYSPIVGGLNPIAPPVRMWFDGHEMRGAVTLGAAYNGPESMVHGGLIALIFDELLGAALAHQAMAGFTGTLSVRYERPTPLGCPLDMRAWCERIEGRKSFARGELLHDGVVTARAEGVFIRPPVAPGGAGGDDGT